MSRAAILLRQRAASYGNDAQIIRTANEDALPTYSGEQWAVIYSGISEALAAIADELDREEA